MAEDLEEKQDKTEEATPERREEFRERGQIPVSKEITAVFVWHPSLFFYIFIFSRFWISF